MHRSEHANLVSCSACGVDLLPGPERTFEFGSRGVLCFECATARGGRFDEVHEHWMEEPGIDDLGSEYD